MPDSPLSDSPIAESPFDVLGVDADASDDELRRAYRRRLRETHPDTGGSAAAFQAVQRAWQRVGTPEARDAYRRAAADRRADGDATAADWAPRPTPRNDSRPRARAYGHPGGRDRERYLELIREWAGRGVDLADPYDPTLVRGAPIEIRHLLADALVEEAAARALGELGIGFTLWHDVAAPGAPSGKIDHLALGASGLFAIQSEDFGGPVNVRRGELAGTGVAGEPLHDLATAARAFARRIGIPLAAAIVVVPDGALGASVIEAGRWRGIPLIAAELPILVHLLKTGAGTTAVSGTLGGLDLFEARSRLQRAVRFA